MHVQVSASAGYVGGRHLDERHDCEQQGDAKGRADLMAGHEGSGRHAACCAGMPAIAVTETATKAMPTPSPSASVLGGLPAERARERKAAANAAIHGTTTRRRCR